MSVGTRVGWQPLARSDLLIPAGTACMSHLDSTAAGHGMCPGNAGWRIHSAQISLLAWDSTAAYSDHCLLIISQGRTFVLCRHKL